VDVNTESSSASSFLSRKWSFNGIRANASSDETLIDYLNDWARCSVFFIILSNLSISFAQQSREFVFSSIPDVINNENSVYWNMSLHHQCVSKKVCKENLQSMIRLVRNATTTSIINWNIISINVGFKYGSNGNYDGNDGFLIPQIENKTRKNTLVFSIRIQCLSQD